MAITIIVGTTGGVQVLPSQQIATLGQSADLFKCVLHLRKNNFFYNFFQQKRANNPRKKMKNLINKRGVFQHLVRRYLSTSCNAKNSVIYGFRLRQACYRRKFVKWLNLKVHIFLAAWQIVESFYYVNYLSSVIALKVK